MNPALHTVTGQQVGETEPGRDHADGAQDRAFVGINFIGGTGQPIAARGRNVFGEGQHGDVLFLGELANAAGDQRALHRRAARRIDGERDGVDAARREGALDRSLQTFQAQPGAPQPAHPADNAGQPENADRGR